MICCAFGCQNRKAKNIVFIFIEYRHRRRPLKLKADVYVATRECEDRERLPEAVVLEPCERWDEHPDAVLLGREINDDETKGKRKGGKLPDRPARPADGLYLSATLQPDLLKCRTEDFLEVKWSTPAQKMINLACVHDKYGLKKFWEEKIESHVQRTGNEDSRMKNSALSKGFSMPSRSQTRRSGENGKSTGAATFMDRKEPFFEPSARSPFLNAPSRQLQPDEKRIPKTQQLHIPQQPEEHSLSDAVTSNTDVTVIQQHILASPRGS
ncbi:hypothetical protein DPX16_5017 [Anabarilius grahami]|uniref:Uncharacterized protein n=1 Tax=Anabarilius grahami TaxID=495550 RepID=A0A3N0ZAL5_ANAGA|nr:hypothetical protein DPX16_5017 [Anabarilius grahami]